ncbi:MAG: O-antigen ligase family protein [Rhodoblastus sp.]|nr:MAG: O-antigen ligase family protein [Rhodoblastus sp.]
MSLASTSAPPVAAARPIVVSAAGFRSWMLWLFVFSGSFVKIEPSPWLLFPLVALIFAASGALSFHRALAPFVLALAMLNVGGLASVTPWIFETRSVTFVLISVYMAATCIFFACLALDDTKARLDTIKSAYAWSAAIASILGLLGYFDVGGAKELFTRNDRAMGFFKDPNVFGPFLVLPLVWLADDVISGAWRGGARRVTLAALWRTMTPLLLIIMGMFLSMSRGAWGVVVAAMATTILLRFFLEADARARARIVTMTLIGVAFLAALLVVALTIPAISDLFAQRASLDQEYDGGAMGRFGGQLRSIPLLLASPNGFGPLRFPLVVGNEDPHNVYINAFAAYGWTGGVAYFALVAMTLLVGWRLALRKGPIARWRCRCGRAPSFTSCRDCRSIPITGAISSCSWA